jgi:NADPH:quinone reductase-like Zn-dependent oxidoreductase
MKAVVFDRPRAFDVRDVPRPEPGPGEVRVGSKPSATTLAA